jgi:hypothetical protein
MPLLNKDMGKWDHATGWSGLIASQFIHYYFVFSWAESRTGSYGVADADEESGTAKDAGTNQEPSPPCNFPTILSAQYIYTVVIRKRADSVLITECFDGCSNLPWDNTGDL